MNREVVLSKEVMIVSETDQKGNILYANDDFCKISGYSKTELKGKAHNVVRHKDMPRAAFEDLWSTLKRGDIWNGIVKNSTKDGDYYWVNATVFTSHTKDGTIRYISVRVKPTKEEIENAISLYKTLN